METVQMMYFIRWLDSKGTYRTIGFDRKEDIMAFIGRYILPNETVTFYTDIGCTRPDGTLSKRDGKLFYKSKRVTYLQTKGGRTYRGPIEYQVNDNGRPKKVTG